MTSKILERGTYLPKGPWTYETTGPVDNLGCGHVYVIDAAGRKIMSLWGKPDEKLAMAELIIHARSRVKENP